MLTTVVRSLLFSDVGMRDSPETQLFNTILETLLLLGASTSFDRCKQVIYRKTSTERAELDHIYGLILPDSSLTLSLVNYDAGAILSGK